MRAYGGYSVFGVAQSLSQHLVFAPKRVEIALNTANVLAELRGLHSYDAKSRSDFSQFGVTPNCSHPKSRRVAREGQRRPVAGRSAILFLLESWNGAYRPCRGSLVRQLARLPQYPRLGNPLFRARHLYEPERNPESRESRQSVETSLTEWCSRGTRRRHAVVSTSWVFFVGTVGAHPLHYSFLGDGYAS